MKARLPKDLGWVPNRAKRALDEIYHYVPERRNCKLKDIDTSLGYFLEFLSELEVEGADDD